MIKAYWASTDLGPFRSGQVLLLDDQDGWTRTGWLVELVDPVPETTAPVHVAVDARYLQPE